MVNSSPQSPQKNEAGHYEFRGSLPKIPSEQFIAKPAEITVIENQTASVSENIPSILTETNIVTPPTIENPEPQPDIEVPKTEILPSKTQEPVLSPMEQQVVAETETVSQHVAAPAASEVKTASDDASLPADLYGIEGWYSKRWEINGQKIEPSKITTSEELKSE